MMLYTCEHFIFLQIAYDIVENIIVQGDSMRDALQELQDAVYLTKALSLSLSLSLSPSLSLALSFECVCVVHSRCLVNFVLAFFQSTIFLFPKWLFSIEDYLVSYFFPINAIGFDV